MTDDEAGDFAEWCEKRDVWGLKAWIHYQAERGQPVHAAPEPEPERTEEWWQR